jgi:AcrR family transcriptional regulator
MSDPRRQRTRQALIDAGLSLFAELPVDAVAIDEITASAGVGKGSFYNHFVSREAFATAIVNEIRIDIEAKIQEANCDGAPSEMRVARAIMLYAQYAMEMPQQATVMVRSDPMQRFDHPLNNNVVADIRQGVVEGVFNVGSIEAGKLFLIGGVGMMILRIGRERKKAVAQEIALEMCALFLCCLGLSRDAAIALAKLAERDLVQRRAAV